MALALAAAPVVVAYGVALVLNGGPSGEDANIGGGLLILFSIPVGLMIGAGYLLHADRASPLRCVAIRTIGGPRPRVISNGTGSGAPEVVPDCPRACTTTAAASPPMGRSGTGNNGHSPARATTLGHRWPLTNESACARLVLAALIQAVGVR